MSRPVAGFSAFLGALAWTLFCVPSGLPAPSDPAELQAGLQRVKVGEGALAFSSGFIRPTAPPLDGLVHRITGDNLSAGNRLLVGGSDVIYLKITNPEGAAPGDYFTLYRRVQEVFHPLRGNFLGDLYLIVGVANVIKVSQDLATVRVIRSYGQITPGDGIMRFVPPPPPEPAMTGRRQPEIAGTIVSIPPQRFLVAQQQVVYIDWGIKDGIAAGDRIDVHRTGGGLPVRKIGEVKVLAVEDDTATAVIVRSTAPFLRGDRLSLHEAPAKGAKGESIAEELERLSRPAPLREMPQAAASSPQDLERRLADLARQLEFEQGSPSVTPGSLPALQQISDILNTVTDKQIRIEGHADDRPIGPALKQQFPSNAELSVARAVGITSYLVEHGVNPSDLTSLGHSDKKPIATNRTEEGRSQNRRIEIVLVPKETARSPQIPASKPEAEAAPPERSQEGPKPLPGLEEAPRVVPPAGEPTPPEKP
jgi:chemotaxis protein MotB